MTCAGSSSDGAIGFLRDPRRLCVSLTRARYSLIVFGSARWLHASGDPYWQAVVDWASERNVLFNGEWPMGKSGQCMMVHSYWMRSGGWGRLAAPVENSGSCSTKCTHYESRRCLNGRCCKGCLWEGGRGAGFVWPKLLYGMHDKERSTCLPACTWVTHNPLWNSNKVND